MPTTPHSIISLYADDTAILATSNEKEEFPYKLTPSFNTIDSFFTSRAISLDMEKTQAIYFSRLNLDTPPPSLQLKGTTINLQTRVTLFKSFITPLLTYAAPIWVSTAAYYRRLIYTEYHKRLRVITAQPPFAYRIDLLHSTRKSFHKTTITIYIRTEPAHVFNTKEARPKNLIPSNTTEEEDEDETQEEEEEEEEEEGVWSGAGMQGWGKREILEKTGRPEAPAKGLNLVRFGGGRAKGFRKVGGNRERTIDLTTLQVKFRIWLPGPWDGTTLPLAENCPTLAIRLQLICGYTMFQSKSVKIPLIDYTLALRSKPQLITQHWSAPNQAVHSSAKRWLAKRAVIDYDLGWLECHPAVRSYCTAHFITSMEESVHHVTLVELLVSCDSLTPCGERPQKPAKSVFQTFHSPLKQYLEQAVHDKVSTFEINLRKMSLPPACIYFNGRIERHASSKVGNGGWEVVSYLSDKDTLIGARDRLTSWRCPKLPCPKSTCVIKLKEFRKLNFCPKLCPKLTEKEEDSQFLRGNFSALHLAQHQGQVPTWPTHIPVLSVADSLQRVLIAALRHEQCKPVDSP
ncbi:hypothetical protein PR048_019252 [Dryococelus australis]|uniref:Reverse transcriptase domain-containing protein n=1 Tax=Dryococelus australis TaxID=614101 RepID=A0ABQ9H326_9NEOP|nr:hypothetical protein PR048_019252 [Dryococelus australis]